MTTDTPSGRRHHIHLVDTAAAGRLRGKALCPRVEHDKSSGAGRISWLEGDFSTQQDPWLCPGTVRIIVVRPIRRLDRALGHAMAKLSGCRPVPHAVENRLWPCSHHVSMQARFLPVRTGVGGTARRVSMIRMRESAGSMTSSISKAVATLRALPCS